VRASAAAEALLKDRAIAEGAVRAFLRFFARQSRGVE
jgi:hypothetical protein